MSKFCPKHGDPKELPHMVSHCTCDTKYQFPLKLLGELLAVQPDEVEGTIKLPDWKRNLTGIVRAVGPEVVSTKVGDRVGFGAAVGMDSVYRGDAVRLLKQDDLDFVLENEA